VAEAAGVKTTSHDATVDSTDHVDQPREVNIGYLETREKELAASVDTVDAKIAGMRETRQHLKDELAEVRKDLKAATG
jgi:prefoldin subunit 5